MHNLIYDETWSVEDIVKEAHKLIGKKLGEIDKSGWLDPNRSERSDKGRIGNMIQADYFGIPANSDKEADFKYHGIELKVTPIKKLKDGTYSAKERLVLGMINFMTDYQVPFEDSHVNHKTGKMLLIIYLHEENKSIKDFPIVEARLFELPKEDRAQVEIDYNNIIEMIAAGKAHEISEKQQKILGACTKGQGKGKDFVQQPKSEELAKSRAYSYKSGYMTNFVRRILAPSEVNRLGTISEEVELKSTSFYKVLVETVSSYINKTDEEICKLIGYQGNPNGKSYIANLTHRLFGDHTKNNVNYTEEFLKNGFAVKTITKRLNKNSNQDMSFPTIDFTEILYDEFDQSSWYTLFVETEYIIAVWEEYEKGKYKLVKFVDWIPNDEFIEQVRTMYEHIKGMLLTDSIKITKVISEDGSETWRDNLPKKGVIKPLQIRPKGTKDSSIYTLDNGLEIKKKTLFIDKEYMWKILNIE